MLQHNTLYYGLADLSTAQRSAALVEGRQAKKKETKKEGKKAKKKNEKANKQTNKQFGEFVVNSFNEAYDNKEMSASQRQAVITLIEKKDKDRNF